jgi:hypothetical protein
METEHMRMGMLDDYVRRSRTTPVNQPQWHIHAAATLCL